MPVIPVEFVNICQKGLFKRKVKVNHCANGDGVNNGPIFSPLF